MVASLALAKQGFEVHLLEKETELGGNLRHIHYTLEGLDPQATLKKIIDEVESNQLIQVHKGVEIKDMSGYVGNYKTRIKTRLSSGLQPPDQNQGESELEHGIIIVATGAKTYEPGEYLYGKDPRVLTQKELEEKIATNDSEISNYQHVVMIQCVGSREEKRPYCSRICCSQAIKNALKLKAANPNSSIFVLYRDLRTYGFREEYYQRARNEGVIFVRYEPDNSPEVRVENGLLKVLFTDLILGERLMISPDLLVLSTGIVPGENESLAKIVKVPLTSDNFFLEAHAKLRPVDFATDGIFLCGLAHSPRFIEESISQANAAAARAATLLTKDHLEAMGIVVGVKERWCSGCGLCVLVCPYEAREIDPETGTARVTEVLCQGCGACAVACPNGATEQKSFEKKQILSMIEAAL
ncbi:MAG: CoB--CoM heterodisulfide reductase iron-sulfur subunit A family protein, partial [Candidatus Zixiibacteriota bacterium]